MNTARLKESLDNNALHKKNKATEQAQKLFDFLLENLSSESIQKIHDVSSYKPTPILLSRSGSYFPGESKNVKKNAELKKELEKEVAQLLKRPLRRNAQFSIEHALKATIKNTDLAELKISIDPLITSITQFAGLGALTNEDNGFTTKFRDSVFYTPPVSYISPLSSSMHPNTLSTQTLHQPNEKTKITQSLVGYSKTKKNISLEAYKALVRKAAEEKVINRETADSKKTVLYVALEAEQFERAKILLEEGGADPSILTVNGDTALKLANRIAATKSPVPEKLKGILDLLTQTKTPSAESTYKAISIAS